MMIDGRCDRCDSRYCHPECHETETTWYVVGAGHLEPDTELPIHLHNEALYRAAVEFQAEGCFPVTAGARQVWIGRSLDEVRVRVRYTADLPTGERGDFTKIVIVKVGEVLDKVRAMKLRKEGKWEEAREVDPAKLVRNREVVVS